MWQKISKHDYVIDYVDKLVTKSRHQGHPGRLTMENGDAVLEPEAGQLTGIKWFAIFFIPLFSLISYLFIPGKQKWLFVIMGPTIGSITFAAIYHLIKLDVDKGAYIQFAAKSNEVILPRLEQCFDKEQVTLQWITGRMTSEPGYPQLNHDVGTDLNLIVQQKDGTKHRYYVMCAPYRKYIKQFAEHAGIPVIEINMGWKGYRDADLETISDQAK